MSGNILKIAMLLVPGSLSGAGGSPPETCPVRGRVLDPAGSPLPGARVRAIPDGPEVRTARDGTFLLPLPAGASTLRISADGLLEATEALDVTCAGGIREFVLELPVVRDTITVTESAGYAVPEITSATKTPAALHDIPQSITVVSRDQIRDQMMMSIADVVRYVPGISAHQGENNRDQVIIRGNNSSADFFVNGVRDDVQYHRDLYNLERVEALKGPNALIFGRGGAGGVVNRVTKEAGPAPVREITLQAGAFGHKRITGDFDRPLGERLAFRVNSLYENSDSFRKFVNIERYGISPALSVFAGSVTRVALGYEHFHDGRTADRGITSFGGEPANVPISTFYGNPDQSRVRAEVDLGSAVLEHRLGPLDIRNRAHFAAYDRGYQNFVPGAAAPGRSTVTLSAYNNATHRFNAFNQTDLNYLSFTGPLRHTFLGGAEAGRQITDNFRNTGYFEGGATSIMVPFGDPAIRTRAIFRQSATDADNHVGATTGSAYIQDQVAFRRVQFVGGVRFDYFDLNYLNNRNRETLRRIDRLASPRAGIVLQPVAPLSVYASYSVSHLPSAGDQFSSLTVVTRQLEPEKFVNYEAGVKWNLRNLSLAAAAYRLNRTNTRSTDPNDPARIVRTGSQRTNGFEAGVTGSITRAWQIAGGCAWQDAFVTRATAAAPAGAQVPQVPHASFSLWNNYRLLPRLGLGLGLVNRSDSFAAIDNTVILPGYTRADAALFYRLAEKIRLQANVENVFDRKYYVNADGNNNISPGFPRAVRVALIARF